MSEKKPDPTRPRREQDPELLALSRIMRIMATLAPDARNRVVTYLGQRIDAENPNPDPLPGPAKIDPNDPRR